MPNAAIALLLTAPLALAAPATPPAATVTPENPAAARTENDQGPAVRDLGKGKFEVGLVTFDQATRQISFPAEINMIDGPLEFAIVHENGKIHESLLTTKTRPLHLNVALKLLRYQPSTELFPILDDDFRPTGKYPKIPEATRNSARVEILVGWKNPEGVEKSASLNDWVTYTVTSKPLPPGPWIYGGSYLHNNVFQAESDGEFAALFTSNSSLFNYPGKDHNLDDVWIPTTKRLPPVGTPVTVTIKPAIPAKPKP